MGKFFVMSKRFNKQSALDFGLSDKGSGMAVNPDDGSLWKKDTLFDFGWGPENGYYRVPLPDFPHLLDIILLEGNDEDVFGAAAIVERQYPEELLEYCENIVLDPGRAEDFEKISRVFQLDYPINRSPTEGKQYQEVLSDSERWERISEYTARIRGENQSIFKKLFGHHGTGDGTVSQSDGRSDKQ